MALLLVGNAVVSHAQTTPAQKCEADENRATGSYAACLYKAQQRFVSRGGTDTAARDAALAECTTTYIDAWGEVEADAMGECPAVEGQAAIRDYIDACVVQVEAALAGDTVPSCESELSACDEDLATCTSQCAATDRPPMRTGAAYCYASSGFYIPCPGSGQDAESMKGLAHSFTDNGDGTITDDMTGLMWEKMSRDGSIHDMWNAYVWAQAFSVKIATLNSMAFAGHADWRVPNIHELETILDLGASAPTTFTPFHSGCTTGCDGVSCSCTKSDYHWSSTTYPFYPSDAFYVSFTFGYTNVGGKTAFSYPVRAVRGGS